MLCSTVQLLRCPSLLNAKGARCGGTLEVDSRKNGEILWGTLSCPKCESEFPILAGVALVVADVGEYLAAHVKGISRWVADSEIPDPYREMYLEAKAEIQDEHIEDDLEAERVNALYVMNHYLHANPAPKEPWWLPSEGKGSALIDELVRKYWDQGPLPRIAEWVSGTGSVIELGCGVGGLGAALGPKVEAYLGLDSSFGSIALARHFVLGAPMPGHFKIPEDLLAGPVSRQVDLAPGRGLPSNVDFIVGDVDFAPVVGSTWDCCVALNVLDMLEEPSDLPRLQARLLKKSGLAIQSCPYIWHPLVAFKLRRVLPKSTHDSAQAAEWLYQGAGFSVEKSVPDVPWLFFKHVRQLEVYSVHLLAARKLTS